MFCFIDESNKWSLGKDEVASLLGKGISCRLLDGFENNPGHRLFALLHSSEPLSGIAKTLQFNPAQTFEHLVEPLHPVTSRKH